MQKSAYDKGKRPQCPFYKEDSGHYHTIVCEGVMSGTTTSVRFGNERNRIAWLHGFCCNIERCKRCPYYTVANMKYD